jgi:hypothetical protein
MMKGSEMDKKEYIQHKNQYALAEWSFDYFKNLIVY